MNSPPTDRTSQETSGLCSREVGRELSSISSVAQFAGIRHSFTEVTYETVSNLFIGRLRGLFGQYASVRSERDCVTHKTSDWFSVGDVSGVGSSSASNRQIS